jgi:very-short-patch-repair endonuclease
MKLDTTENFINKATLIHKDKYDYSLVNYKNSKKKVIIICKKHGKFLQIPNSHLNGRGCKKCIIPWNKKTSKDFIKDAIKKHNNLYDYSLVNYINNGIKVIIICKKHGRFLQTPNSHLNGRGCPTCKNVNVSTIDFINKSKKKHNNKYNYSITNYINNRTKVIIICKKHGKFLQTPQCHLKGNGCQNCSKEYFKSITKTTKEFIKQAKLIHKDTYDYSKTKYINTKTKVIIICKKHGDFLQGTTIHLYGRGCPTCNSSKGEIIIMNFLNKYKVKYCKEYRFKNQPKHIKKCRYDFYLPSFNTIIEYHGAQHFNFSNYFHEDYLSMLDDRKRDYEKMKFCKDNNINYLEIHYNHNIIKKLTDFATQLIMTGKPLEP